MFHVAGTNGKGSTVATLDALLRHNGLRVGRYTSPHLVDFTERIVAGGRQISPDAVTEWLTTHEPLLTRLGATFFEATTAMALAHFAAERVDVAIVEVGLGGRLDATNIVEPIAAGVTQIGFDHMEYLGDTLERIAMEKAGIFKPGVGAVVGDTRPAIRDLLAAHAVAVGAGPVLVTGWDWQIDHVALSNAGTSFERVRGGQRERLTTPLVGAFQANNTAVALAMLEAAGPRWSAIASTAHVALADVQLSGRFHRWGHWLFDVAHNADGAATIVATVEAMGAPRPVVAVVCVLRDKDWRGMLHTLSGVADHVIVTNAPTAPKSRAWSLEEVASWAQGAAITVERVDDFDEALHLADLAGATVLVTGSFHTVGDAMERLQVDPLVR